MTPPRMPPRETVPFNLYKPGRPGRAKVLSTKLLTAEGPEEVRHIVVDLEGLDYQYLEGQSLGALPPGTDEKGKPHKIRLYSIASTRQGDDGARRTASLCVKRALWTHPETGALHKGVCSNYLCDLREGDDLLVTGPAGKAFLLPEGPDDSLVLVATGTGIAPFRAFLKRIYEERSDWTGRVVLVFGVRTAAELLYGEELRAFADRPGFAMVTALSREETNAEGQRMYVQHRLAEEMEQVWPLFQRDDAYLYVCGLKGMEEGIESAFVSYGEHVGSPWAPRREELDEHGRILIETY